MKQPDKPTLIPTQILLEVWRAKVLTRLYGLIEKKNPTLITSYEGEIKRLGDQVIFRERRTLPIIEYVTADKITEVRYRMTWEEVMRCQEDISRMDVFAENMVRCLMLRAEIPSGEALFAGQILLEDQSPHESDYQLIFQFIYGFVYKDFIRSSIQIVINSKEADLSDEEIIENLKNKNFSNHPVF